MKENIYKILNTDDENYLFNHLSKNFGKMHEDEWISMLHQLVEPIHKGRKPYCMQECASQMLDIIENLAGMFCKYVMAGEQDMATELFYIIDPLYNTTVDGLVLQEFDKAGECFTRLAQVAEKLRTDHVTEFRSILVIPSAIKWMSSPHRESAQQIMLTYLDDMNLSHRGHLLPELFISTDIFAEDYFWDANLSLRTGNEQQALAISAAIQHLRYGHGVPMDKVVPILAKETPKESYINNSFWLSRLHSQLGIADRERTKRFFADYCEQVVTVAAKEDASILKKLGKNLDIMCSDRSITYNAFSKRVLIEHDMGCSL